jgi:hypothetical protein
MKSRLFMDPSLSCYAACPHRRHTSSESLAMHSHHARESAYALPAKLAIPMTVCIFPVLFVVILLPVVVRLCSHHY